MTKRILALTLCAIMIICSMGLPAFAGNTPEAANWPGPYEIIYTINDTSIIDSSIYGLDESVGIIANIYAKADVTYTSAVSEYPDLVDVVNGSIDVKTPFTGTVNINLLNGEEVAGTIEVTTEQILGDNDGKIVAKTGDEADEEPSEKVTDFAKFVGLSENQQFFIGDFTGLSDIYHIGFYAWDGDNNPVEVTGKAGLLTKNGWVGIDGYSTSASEVTTGTHNTLVSSGALNPQSEVLNIGFALTKNLEADATIMISVFNNMGNANNLPFGNKRVLASRSSEFVPPPVIVKGINANISQSATEENVYEITLNDDEEWIEGRSVEMIFPAFEGAEDGDEAYIVHEHADKSIIYVGTVEDGKISITNETGFSTFTVNEGGLAEAAAAAEAGDTISVLGDVTLESAVTLPAGITLNGNGSQINGEIKAGGALEIKGHIKATTFTASGKTITIGEGATLEQTTGRMVIGHGATFNITGSVEDAKTADTASLTPSLIAPGASFTGNGVNFNAENAYIKFTDYCSSKNSAANKTFSFNIENSVWDQTNKLAFEEPTNNKTPKVKFNLTDSVLNTTSHLVFAITDSDVVFDNSNVNADNYRQLENRGNLTVKNGSVVYASNAVSSNAKNPGTLTIDNAKYVGTGELSGADLGTGTLILKNNADATFGKISKENITLDASSSLKATSIAADATIALTFDNVANKKVLDLSESASREGKINIPETLPDGVELEYGDDGDVTVLPYVAEVGATKYLDIKDALKAVTTENNTLNILSDITIDGDWDCRYTGSTFTVPVTINGGGHTLKFTGKISDPNHMSAFRFESDATVNNLTLDLSEATSVNTTRIRAISAKADLTVSGCTFIGNPDYTNTRAIIFGEGAGTAIGDVDVTVTNSTFTNWSKGLGDNESSQDAKTVTATGNTFTNASVALSAAESVTFSNNKVENGYVTIMSYADVNELSVVAEGNTLDETAVNYIKAAQIRTDGEGFKLPVADINGKKYVTLQEAVNNATADDVIVLTDDISNEVVKVKGNVTITDKAPAAVMLLAEGDDVTLTNVIFEVANNASLALDDIAVRGTSYIKADTPDTISVTNCDIDVTTDYGCGTPPAFIAFGNENASGQVKLVFKNNTLLAASTNSAQTHGIAGWNYIKSATINGNTFGSAEAPLTAAAVKLMNFTEGATVDVNNNTFYVNSADSTHGPDALQLYQNNSRANNYKAVISANNFYVDDATAAIGINVNAMNNPEKYPGNGQVEIDKDNKVNGSAIAIADILVFGNSIADIGHQDYVGLGIGYDESGKIIAGTFSEYSAGLNEFLADDYVAVKNAVSGWLEVCNEDAFANNISIKFVKADADDEGNDTLEGADKYNIVLEATSDIHEFASAEFTFKNESKLLSREAMPYVIEAADNMTLSTVQGKPDYYGFAMEGDKEYQISGKTITLGAVTFTGYGSVDFSVAGGRANATTVMNNLVKTFEVDGAVSGDVTKGELVITEGTIKDITIEVPVRDLAINIDFPNAVANQKKAYQDMKVVISGGDLTENIEIELGSDAEETALTIAGKTDAKYSTAYNNNEYAIAVTDALTLNRAYTVTVSGAGYRTARYTVTMTKDKELNFWNNVMDEETAVEEGELSEKKNFLAGDIVKDNNINIYDLSAVVSYFGTDNIDTEEVSDYAKYDLNRDGVIDSRDVAYVLVSWGE